MVDFSIKIIFEIDFFCPGPPLGFRMARGTIFFGVLDHAINTIAAFENYRGWAFESL